MMIAEASVVDDRPGCPDSYENQSARWIEQEILDFDGECSGGSALFDALYGDTLYELLPPRLTDLLNGRRVA